MLIKIYIIIVMCMYIIICMCVYVGLVIVSLIKVKLVFFFFDCYEVMCFGM